LLSKVSHTPQFPRLDWRQNHETLQGSGGGRASSRTHEIDLQPPVTFPFT
jgi:hypothetical protein